MSISATIVAFNCIHLDYPLEASVRSALEVADEVFVNEGNSFDETKGTFSTPLYIVLHYGYTDTISKEVKIKKILTH